MSVKAIYKEVVRWMQRLFKSLAYPEFHGVLNKFDQQPIGTHSSLPCHDSPVWMQPHDPGPHLETLRVFQVLVATPVFNSMVGPLSGTSVELLTASI